MPMILILATLFSLSARAEVQTITCREANGKTNDKLIYKLTDGRPSTRHKKSTLRYKGPKVFIFGSTPEVDEYTDGETSDGIVFERTFLGFAGQFQASYETCASDCITTSVRCTSVIR